MATTKKTAGTDVAETPKGGALTQMPDWMKGHEGQGVEGVGTEDIEIPRIKLMQAISEEVEANDDIRPGEFYHTIAETSLGREVAVTIVMVDIRYLLWNPRWDGGGILARCDDGVHWSPPNKEFTVHPIKGDSKTAKWVTKPTLQESGLAEWGSSNPDDSNSQPAATKMYNLLVSFDDHPELGFAVVTLQRSAIKVARKLIGKIKITNMPSYGMKFIMTSVQEKGQEGPYQQYAFRAAGFEQDEARFKYHAEAHKRFKSEGINIKDLEDAQDEGGETASGGRGGEAAEDSPI